MKLRKTFRAVFETIAAIAALWALLVSSLMLIGTHGISSNHDRFLGKICLLGSIGTLMGIWWIEKKYPWAKEQ
jgi:hypothetical protein